LSDAKPEFEQFAVDARRRRSYTSKEAAAAAAAHDVFPAVQPDQKSVLDAALAASLFGIAETEAIQNFRL